MPLFQPKIEPGKPYTLTVAFNPRLSNVQQLRMLTALTQNHLIVITDFNRTGGTILTMYPTAEAAKGVAVGKTLFSVGTGSNASKAIITRIRAGSPLSG